MEPRIENISKRYFTGMRTRLSFAQNKTRELWQSFMPKKKDISGVIGNELYSIEVYTLGFFEKFDPTVSFEKWAAVEVSNPNTVSEGMENFAMPLGLYAVFIHKGPASEGQKTYQYIFSQWIPKSQYRVDNRPHFAVMGEKYRPEDQSSEEEIWIPIKSL